jgi:hypothetical protein
VLGPQLVRDRQSQPLTRRYHAADHDPVMVAVLQPDLAVGEQVPDEEALAQHGRVEAAELGGVGRMAGLHRETSFH